MATSRHRAALEFNQILMTLAPEIAPRQPERPASSDLELSLAVLERERREFHLELLEAAHVQRRLSGPRQLSRGVRLDWHSDELEYCNAGHPPALLLRRDSGLERLETGGPVLGVIAGAAFEPARIAIRPGDMLLGCSDGVLECRNRSDEEFGDERFQAKAREHAGEPAHAVLFSILGGLQDFAVGMPRQDDVSLLVIRHIGAEDR